MKVYIEFDTDNACFEDNFEGSLTHVLAKAALKIQKHVVAYKRCVVLPEATDNLLDINGNTIGSVKTEF